ncbi:hypothetical protein [Flavobacterium branchiophilum]|uniref:hypothetical protein n=1 Tax=Flavobacterium branchiophilum TaxID=55197 RepID=UPI001680CCB3|nr:hypothetical protein [Flavobacterium branchiophilum]
MTKRLLFYWVTSFILAIILYYILWTIMPNHYVFGAWYRMFLYHWQHPISFIAIPCFFYGIIATLLADKFSKQKVTKQILLTIGIIILTIILSSPFGGMLWHYYDMKAGHFPQNWIGKMIRLGFEWGLEVGWLIIGLSIPYNIIGSIACYFLTKKGVELFNTK